MRTAIPRPARSAPALGLPIPEATRYMHGMERLIEVVQELSLARTLDGVMKIVRSAARDLAGADGATFVLRDGDFCYYAEEDAIAPLWKGRRFPMLDCISGWSMLHREPAVIPDIRVDPRIPADAYRPTFVKSLAMVPIRIERPIGAIGTYWAGHHRASAEELRLLQALADSTSVALENVELLSSLEQRVAERTRALDCANRELGAHNRVLQELQREKEALSALLVHDMRCPADTMILCGKARLRSAALSDEDRRYWQHVVAAGETISRMAENLLDIAQAETGSLRVEAAPLDLAALARDAAEAWAPIAEEHRQAIDLELPDDPVEIVADRKLLHRVLQNLLDNALDHSAEGSRVRITLVAEQGARVELSIDDDGPGIPPQLRDAVFEKHVRLANSRNQGTGRGLGLTFCRLAVEAHGGRIWAEASASGGSSFRMRLPRRARSGAASIERFSHWADARDPAPPQRLLADDESDSRARGVFMCGIRDHPIRSDSPGDAGSTLQADRSGEATGPGDSPLKERGSG